uniref:Tc1-like transposase DDE domain-containing protein n=1 Tax=Gasterosteus aculeatus aculeatus TaxID=481459 RepID=A0AAQ4RR26_GASAC
MTVAWRGLSGKGHSNVWGSFTRSGLSLELLHQEPPHTDGSWTSASNVAFLLSSRSGTTNNVRSVLPGLKTKITGLLLSGPKSSFLMRANVASLLETKVPESGGRETRNPRCLKSSVKSPQPVLVWGAMSSAGVGPLCFIKSRVNAAVYQDILEHFMLPSADKLYGDADFIFQDLAPAHTAKSTKTWFNDHGITVLDWPANSMGDCQEKDERLETKQCRRAEGC